MTISIAELLSITFQQLTYQNPTHPPTLKLLNGSHVITSVCIKFLFVFFKLQTACILVKKTSSRLLKTFYFNIFHKQVGYLQFVTRYLGQSLIVG